MARDDILDNELGAPPASISLPAKTRLISPLTPYATPDSRRPAPAFAGRPDVALLIWFMFPLPRIYNLPRNAHAWPVAGAQRHCAVFWPSAELAAVSV